MTIEQQVAGLVTGQAEIATGLQAIQTTLTAIQGTLANPPAATVDLTPVTTAVAALDAKVQTVLDDISTDAPAPTA